MAGALPTLARGRRLVFCLALLVLAGCTATDGDLGRPRPTVWSQVIAPQIGGWAAIGRGETVSGFRFTDDEEQLRDRAWRFVMPGHQRSVFDGEISNLIHQRVLPVSAQSQETSAYVRALTGGAYASQASRYNRLAEDANADRLLIGPFRANAGRVVAADRVRLKAVEGSALVAPDARDPAYARVVENEGLVLWVCERLRFRIDGYRYALANLVVETPSREAVRAERAIAALEAEAGPLCSLPLNGVFTAPTAPVQRDGGPPVVYKG